MKTCNRCKKYLNDSEFHKCKSITDGLQHQCKKCRSEYQSAYRATDKGKERDRRYNGSKSAREAYKRYGKEHPNIRAAHQAIKNELRSGRMKKSNCEECGVDDAKIHGHHPDYAKPLDVRWLCSRCHEDWHRENGEGLNG